MIAVWLIGCIFLTLALVSRRLENFHLLQSRKKGKTAQFGIRDFWSAFSGVIENNDRIASQMGGFEGMVKRAEIPWLRSGTDLIAYTILGSILLGIVFGWIAGLFSKDFVLGVIVAFFGMVAGVVFFPFAVRSEEKKKTKLLDKEVMESLPLFGTYFEAGAKGKAVVDAMIESLDSRSYLRRRLVDVQKNMSAKGHSFLMSLQLVAQEWNSKSWVFLNDLIDKSDRSGLKVSDEIKRVLEQNKESDMLTAVAEAESKEQIILFVCIGVLYGPGMLFLLKLAMQFMNNNGI